MSDFRACFITTPNPEAGQKLARVLLEAKLAACVNLINAVSSFYWWEGSINEDSEALLMVKTRADRLDALIETVRANHEYSVPEVISLPILEGNPDYLKWLGDSLEAGGGS